MYTCRIGYVGPFGFFPLSPQVRKLDTREPGPLSGKFLAGQTRDLSLGSEVPAGASAVLLNVTITSTVNGGFLTLFKAGTARPLVSHINWSSAGQTLANNATVAVSAASAISIYCGGSEAPQTDVVIDLLGYFR